MNSSERWEKIKDIFEGALSRAGAERRAFLEGACGADGAMLREVESLLSSFDAEYLEGAAVEEVAEAFVSKRAIELKSGTMLGPYRIVAELGKGGQGAVYKALDTRLDRAVAIKALPDELTIDDTARKRFQREARLASSLDHPNICAVHDLAEFNGEHFIVMQFVEGKNVRELVNGTPLELQSALRIGIQVCDALAAAHERGIIHRDIKAHNVIVTAAGTAKVLDFGLAKLMGDRGADRTDLTELGSPYGTPTYAAPEQSRGEKVDHRADVFSTAVLLYEMLTGTWAFHGKTAIDVRHAVLYDEPMPIADRRGEEVPPELAAIVERGLAKVPANRFQSMIEMRDALVSVLRGQTQVENSTGDEFFARFEAMRPQHFVSPRKKMFRIAAVAGISIAIITAGAYYLYRRDSKLKQAASDALLVSTLAKQQRYFEAYDLANNVLAYLPADETVRGLMSTIGDDLTVTSNEAGASVYLTRYLPGARAPRELVGVTPLEHRQIARGEYLIEVEKDGFVPFKRTFSGNPEGYSELIFVPPPTTLDVKLLRTEEVPDRMTFVPGGEYQMVSWKRPSNTSVELADFFIDRFEVSNREFEEFIRAGGYVRREFWTHPFIRDGRQINAAAAIAELTDRTGLPGPRTWVNQKYPEGKSDHPVTDITWYETAAYAAFRGKTLPTLFQWEKAARNGAFTQSSDAIMPWGYFAQNGKLDGRANMASRDTVPVEANEFGASPFGCYNMAGNVAEWCLNQLNDGFAATGGSWNEPTYSFGAVASYPATFSSNRLGFRCVKNLGAPGADAARINSVDDIPKYAVTTPQKLAQLATFYRYDKTAIEGRTTEVIETPDWRRERIEYPGGNDDKVVAYLYLPRNAAPPYQVITYLPAGDVFGGFITLHEHVEVFAAPQIKAGRAVFAIALAGFRERPYPPDRQAVPMVSVRFRDILVNQTRDMQRGLDYLETRADIDMSRVAFSGYSAGVEAGMIFTAIDKRLKAAIYIAPGISLNNARRVEEANIANFAPHVLIPKLLIVGRYDEEYSWPAETEPLFNLFREPKQLVQYDAGHSPPPEIAVPAVAKWLDEKLGPVRR